MFIRTKNGAIVNLSLVGEIEVRNLSYSGDEYSVLATTGAGGDDGWAVYSILYSGTETGCKEYIVLLWKSLPSTLCITVPV